MTDATKSKMYLGVAVILVIAEILLMAFGNGRLPISGLVLFIYSATSEMSNLKT